MADATETKPSEAQPLLTVYTFDVDHKQYSFVPFATKLHFRLRHAGIPYADGAGTRSEAPKDKVPYVRFLETGHLMGDTGLITRKLIADGRMADLNARLSPEQRAADFCLRSMVEDRMYFLLLYERWYENYAAMRDHGPFSYLPRGVRHVVGVAIFQYVRIILYCQGTGRHSLDEVRLFREEAVAALGDYAGAALAKAADTKQPFWILGGPAPTEADFALFGYLSGMLVTATQPATTTLIKENKALVSYVERIHHTYFPDFKNPL